MTCTLLRIDGQTVHAFTLGELRRLNPIGAELAIDSEGRFRLDTFDDDGGISAFVLDDLRVRLHELGSLVPGSAEIGDAGGHYRGCPTVWIRGARFAARTLAAAAGDGELAVSFQGAVLCVDKTAIYYWDTFERQGRGHGADARLFAETGAQLEPQDPEVVELLRPIWAAMDEAADEYAAIKARCTDEVAIEEDADEAGKLFCAAGCLLGDNFGLDPDDCEHDVGELSQIEALAA